jgi:hypothetical protein
MTADVVQLSASMAFSRGQRRGLPCAIGCGFDDPVSVTD